MARFSPWWHLGSWVAAVRWVIYARPAWRGPVWRYFAEFPVHVVYQVRAWDALGRKWEREDVLKLPETPPGALRL